MKNFYKKYSSKISSMYIELNDYSYYHSPIDLNETDDQTLFIGRERIIDRFINILTKNFSNSGAYLVTGYRGMGKTSFVRKVIHLLNPERYKNIFPRVNSIFVYGFIQLVILYLIKFWKSPLVEFIIIPFILLFLIPIIEFDLINNSLLKRKKGYFNFYIKEFLKNCLYYRSEKHKWKKHLSFLHKMWITQLSLLITFCIFLSVYFLKYSFFFNLNQITLVFWINFSITGYIITYLLTIISKMVQNLRSNYKFEDENKRHLVKVWNSFMSLFKSIFFSRLILPISIDLSSDNLKDHDVMNMLAIELQKSHKKYLETYKFTWNSISKYFSYIFLFIILYLMVIYPTLDSKLEPFVRNNMLPKYEHIELVQNGVVAAGQVGISKTMTMNSLSGVYKSETLTHHHSIGAFGRKINIYGVIHIIRLYAKEFYHQNLIKTFYFQFLQSTSLLKIFIYLIQFLLFVFLVKLGNYLLYLFFPNSSGLYTFKRLYHQITFLKERIESQVEEALSPERISALGILSFLGNLFNKRKVYPIAVASDIEKEVIEYLYEINKLASRFRCPEFIIIFDELDKIEPHSNISLYEMEEIDTSKKTTGSYYTMEHSRIRQHAVFNLLSNLKHFLTTAKAKFIFIAGREMFDASLADVSDRNFFIGSIFHQVINVESFYSDLSDNKSTQLTSMTESFLCRYLIPKYYQTPGKYKYTRWNLKTYNQYLKDYLNLDNKEREKVIYTLQHFVLYLAYRSNGAPKKITNLIEEYVCSKPLVSEKDNALEVGFKQTKLYLRFGYYDQYNFELINYLVSPVLLLVSASIKDYGDKLLVATSFLIDHIFKFHRTGFSMQDLELMPEMLSLNKTPDLREVVQRILNHLSRTHLEQVNNGLFDFVFSRKIVEEISFLSKVSERESAAFNFTLDESWTMKQYHYSKLAILEAKYKDHTSHVDSNVINAIVFYHSILGDLHFYDEEYNDALTHYKEAVQQIRNCHEQYIKNTHTFILFVHNFLKIGFTYEKINNYELAYEAYESISKSIVDFRELDVNALGLSEAISPDKMHVFIEQDTNYDSTFFKEIRFNEDVLKHLELQKKGVPYKATDFWDILLNTNFTTTKETFLSKISLIENCRLFYQPFIARLHMIEKITPGGIVETDIHRIENEFEYMEKIFRPQEKPLIKMEFYRRLGNILYFKHGSKTLFHDNEQSDNCEGCTCEFVPICKSCKYYKENILRFVEYSHSKQIKTAEDNISWFPASPFSGSKITILLSDSNLKYDIPKIFIAYSFDDGTSRSFSMDYNSNKKRWNITIQIPPETTLLKFSFLDDKLRDINNNKKWLIKINKLELLSSIVHICFSSDLKNFDSNELRELSVNLSLWANALLSCTNDTPETITTDQIQILKKIMLITYIDYEDNNSKLLDEYIKILNEINKTSKWSLIRIIIINMLSGHIYKQIGSERDEAFQIRKILYLITKLKYLNCNKLNCSDVDLDDSLKFIKMTLLKRAIDCFYQSFNNIHRVEIEREKMNLMDTPLLHKDFVDISRISLQADIQEIMILFEHMKLDVIELKINRATNPVKNGWNDLLNNYRLKKNDIIPSSSLNLLHNRVLATELKARANDMIFNSIFEKQLGASYSIKVNPFEKLFNLTYDFLKTNNPDTYVETLLSKIQSFSHPKEKSLTNSQKFEFILNFIEYLITDTVFCLLSAVKQLNIAGNSYRNSFLSFANLYYYLGKWCNYLSFYIRYFEEHTENEVFEDFYKRIIIKLEDTITKGNLEYLSPRYHFSKSFDYYQKAYEVHHQGNAYQTLTQNMYYLTDDYNSDVIHFSACMERHLYSTQKTKDRIININKILNESTIFAADHYTIFPKPVSNKTDKIDKQIWDFTFEKKCEELLDIENDEDEEIAEQK